MRPRCGAGWTATFAPQSRLIDLGCGTGLDAVRMAQLGHRVTATDWSPHMVERTHTTAPRANSWPSAVQARAIGAHELASARGRQAFDGAYSNLGAAQLRARIWPPCRANARACSSPAAHLSSRSSGASVPWEIAYYRSHARWARVKVRFARAACAGRHEQAHHLDALLRPREFYRAFRGAFHARALSRAVRVRSAAVPDAGCARRHRPDL